jgi:hypothetical protein
MMEKQFEKRLDSVQTVCGVREYSISNLGFKMKAAQHYAASPVSRSPVTL